MKLTESYKREIYNKIMEALAPIVREKLNESSASPKWIEYNKENVEKYKSKGNLLQNAKVGAETFGWICNEIREESKGEWLYGSFHRKEQPSCYQSLFQERFLHIRFQQEAIVHEIERFFKEIIHYINYI